MPNCLNLDRCDIYFVLKMFFTPAVISNVLFFELMAVLAKLVFGETVDDELDQIREHISQQKARAYMEAITSPVAGARNLLEASYQ